MSARKSADCTWYILAVLFGCCFGFPQFQSKIPNGEIVPHPCKPNYSWKGVGHLNPNGGGDRNPFGHSFYSANKTWTRELCQADSDGDGLTNGQELGDPYCVWIPGAQPNRTAGLSHPGVCQPFDSPACANKTNQLHWVNCNYEDFKCDAINNTDTKNVSIRFPVTQVPANETTYMCMAFDLPSDQEYHLIAIEPMISNADIMHHMVLFGCQDSTHEVNQPYQCGMSAGYSCFDFLGVWSVGLNGQCIDEKAGFRIGQKGFKRAALQLHWNNPYLRSDYNDSSGVTLYYTDKLRQYDAGIFLIGQTRLQIPPGQERIVTTSSCPGECTKALMRGPVYITAAFNHMHYLGINQNTSVIHSGGLEETLAYDEVYNYDSPVVHTFTDPIRINPSDSFTSTCVYRSTSRSEYTFFGEATKDEMCFAFISYYPKENITTGMCTSYGNISDCGGSISVIDGCDYTQAFNLSIPSVLKTYLKVTSACSSDGQCKQACVPVAKEVKCQPCFKGSNGLYLRELVPSDLEERAADFYKALDSCDKEIKGNSCQDDNMSSGGISLQVMFSVLTFTLIIWLML